MKLFSFQWSNSKMHKYKLKWIGDTTKKDKAFRRTMQIVYDCTSEHDGEVTALVVLGEKMDIFIERIPFVAKDRLFLAIFGEHFIVILDESVLNIEQLIFMYDNNILKYSELFTNLNLNCFF